MSANPPAIKRARVIELRGVGRAYGAVRVIHDLDLLVEAGEFVAIVGESGSGKTTTLKTINRLLDPDSGEVLVDGVPTRVQPAHLLRRRIGYVFQRIGLFPHLTVAENIGVTPKLLGWSSTAIAARVVELLELVNLPQTFSARRPAELSGGQRQRVGVARALAARPSIMLMDEPFGSLDPVTRDLLGSEYRRLHERMRLTTLMVTHDVLEAVLLADRVVVMHSGSIVADGPPRDLMNDHPDETVRALMDMPRRQALRVAALLEERARG